MRKRLRKKLHCGEYREYGFDLNWMFSGGLNSEDIESFWNDLIDFIEARQLILGGGSNQNTGGVFITRGAAPGADAEDQMAVLSWVKQHNTVANASVGELVDAWAWKDSNAA